MRYNNIWLDQKYIYYTCANKTLQYLLKYYGCKGHVIDPQGRRNLTWVGITEHCAVCGINQRYFNSQEYAMRCKWMEQN